jgi:hypothetical protein
MARSTRLTARRALITSVAAALAAGALACGGGATGPRGATDAGSNQNPPASGGATPTPGGSGAGNGSGAGDAGVPAGDAADGGAVATGGGTSPAGDGGSPAGADAGGGGTTSGGGAGDGSSGGGGGGGGTSGGGSSPDGGVAGGGAPDGGVAGGGPASGAPGSKAWFDAFPGDHVATVDSMVADVGGGVLAGLSDLVDVGRPPPPPDSASFTILRIDDGGRSQRVATFGPRCSVHGRVLAVTRDGSIVASVRSECPDAVAGLGPDPVHLGAAVLLDRDGRFIRRMSIGLPDDSGVFHVRAAPDRSGLVVVANEGAEVRRVALDDSVVWSRSGFENVVLDAVPTADGGAVLVVNPSRVLRVAADGRDVWSVSFPSSVVETAAILTDGSIALTGFFGPLLQPGPRPGETKLPWGVVALGADGTVEKAAQVSDLSFPIAVLPVATPDGGVVVSVGTSCVHVIAFTGALERRWERDVSVEDGVASCTLGQESVVVSETGRLVVAGGGQSYSDFGDGDRVGTGPGGFVEGVNR